MNCKAVRKKLHDYLDFRLTARDAAKIEEHLEACTSCHQLHREYLSLKQMLSPRIKLPDPSSTRLLAKIKRKKTWWEPRGALRQFGRDCRTFF